MTATTLITPGQLLFQDENSSFLLWEDKIANGPVSLTYTFLDLQSYGLPDFYGSVVLGNYWKLNSTASLLSRFL